MKQSSLEIIVWVSFFVFLYYCFSQLLPNSEYLIIGLILLIVFTTQTLRTKLWSLIFYRRSRVHSHLLKKLNDFNTNLNMILDYNQLLSEYCNLFNTIFKQYPWALYVYETTNFQLVRYSKDKDVSLLPSEIDLPKLSKKKTPAELPILNSDTIFSKNLDQNIFLNLQLDRTIPIEGKNQTFAILFVNHHDLFFLNSESTAHLFKRVLIKSGPILENTGLYLDLLERNLQIKKLFQVSHKILSSLKTEQIFDFLLDALADIISYDAAVIFLLDSETKELHREVSKGYGAGIELTLKLDQGACGWVARNKKISLLKDVTKAKYYHSVREETKAQIALPLQVFNEIIGVLCLESDRVGYFTSNSLEILSIFANQAAIALNNAKQYEISLAKQSLEHELLKASRVQQVLLPEHPPVYKNLNIAFAHIASRMVSGDLFDLVPLDQQTLGVIIGDVSGKGAHAAIMMSLVLAGFRAYKKTYLEVCEVIARLNNLLQESFGDGQFATAFYALISTESNNLIYTNAGHNPPIIIRADGSSQVLKEGGIVLGFLPNEVYKQTTVPFHPGDTLICYTDGITEAMNEEGTEFGENRLLSELKTHITSNSYDLKENILSAVKKFTHSRFLADDQTLVIVKYES